MKRAHLLHRLMDVCHRAANTHCRRTPERHHGDLLGYALMALAVALDRDMGRWDDDQFIHYVAMRARFACQDYLREIDTYSRDERDRLEREGRATPTRTRYLDDLAWEQVCAPDASPEDMAIRALDTAFRMRGVMDGLRPRERWIVEQTFFFDRTLADVGEEMGLSETRTSQIRQEALRKMRAKICEQAPKD